MFKIIYLPTAEYAKIANHICSDRSREALLNVIEKYPAYYVENRAFFMSEHTTHPKLAKYLIPKHLLEVVEI